jgi:flavin reductase (DIM6/NTAB) family NADH-FMN oxidoreductase RutF
MPDAAASLDPATFRSIVGQFPTGVAIVTAQGSSGPAGLTTNAITSLSLDPLLLIVCFDNTSRTLPIVRECGRFGVNILRAGDEELAALFASKRVAREKFESVTHTVDHGVPVLDDALAWVVCDVDALHAGGDHTIGVGSVTAAGHGEPGEPLVFYGGVWRRLAGDSSGSRQGRPPDGGWREREPGADLVAAVSRPFAA